MSEITPKKIKNFFKKLPRRAAEHCFLAFLILVFIVLIIGSLQFYQYSFLTEKSEPEISKAKIQFEENLYQKILSEWQNREERFEFTEQKEYSNPFSS